jgi:hypothetical protein
VSIATRARIAPKPIARAQSTVEILADSPYFDYHQSSGKGGEIGCVKAAALRMTLGALDPQMGGDNFDNRRPT